VKLDELEYRLFDLNYLTQHYKTVNSTAIRGEKGHLAPEVMRHAQVFPKTDIWSLGHLLLSVFDSRNRSQVDLAKLKSNPIKELEAFFGKNIQDGNFLSMISAMLQLDHEKRCDYLTCFQLQMFK